jgi:hypothetical protein
MKIIKIIRYVFLLLAEFSTYRARRPRANHDSASKRKQSQNVRRKQPINMLPVPDDDDEEDELSKTKTVAAYCIFFSKILIQIDIRKMMVMKMI